MSQLAYYLVVIVLGLGNLVLAAIAYRQRDRQIKGNALRETQVELAELRNEMAQRRMEYLGMQVQLLQEIRDALAERGGAVTTAPGPSPQATRPPRARTSRRSHQPPHAPL